LTSGEHVTSGLVAARSLAAAPGLLTAHRWVGRPRSRLYGLNRTKVSISTKKKEIEDVIRDLEVPDEVLFFCESRCTGAIETEP